MSQSLRDIEYLVGSEQVLVKMENAPAMSLFSEKVVAFLNALSKNLMTTGKQYPEIATFAFWCRRAAIMQRKAPYEPYLSSRLGRGLAFHVAPSNVPVNFAFSLVAGLLAGNANIVKVPSKPFEQVQIISQAIKDLLENEHADLQQYICLIRYPRIGEVTDYLSKICSSRIIWGGDNTIREIRKSEIGPRTKDVTFADRNSFCVIDAEAYLDSDKKRTTSHFYNDTFLTDQNACTSPRLVVWTGMKIEQAKHEFWCALEDYAKKQYDLSAVQSVGKLAAFYRASAGIDGLLLETSDTNYITRMRLSSLPKNLFDYRYNSGFFFEYETQDLREILMLCDRKVQTISYIGELKTTLQTLIYQAGVAGVDRIVPTGSTMDFSLRWDGYDLIFELSRIIDVE